jgi:hypothetical protein
VNVVAFLVCRRSRGSILRVSTSRPQLRDQLTQEQIDALVRKAVEKADSGESILLKFMLEQIFGKAPQPSHEHRRR